MSVPDLGPDFGTGDRVEVAEPPPRGIRATYTADDGREFSALSGIAGEIGGTDTGQTVMVRGHEARILINEIGDTFIALWREAPRDELCSQYAAIGTGFAEREFRRLVQEID